MVFIYIFFRLVGRAAFTGNYNWIHSQNCAKEAHPPEVYIIGCLVLLMAKCKH